MLICFHFHFFGRTAGGKTLFGCKVSGEINKAAGAVPSEQEFSGPVLGGFLMKYELGEQQPSSSTSDSLAEHYAYATLSSETINSGS